MDMAWVEIEYFGNSLRAWAIAGGVMMAVIVGLELARGLIVRRLGKLAGRTANPIDDLLVDLARRIKLFGVAAVGLYIGTRFLVLPAQVGAVVGVIPTVGFFDILVQFYLPLPQSWYGQAIPVLREMAFGAMLILVLLFRPSGVLGDMRRDKLTRSMHGD